MNQIFLFYLIRSNLVDLFQSLFYLSATNLQSYCSVELVDKFVVLNKSNFVLLAEAETKLDFRKILWSQHTTWLDNLCQSSNKDFGIGNFDHQQIDFLQKHFSNSTTISFNYTSNFYPALLENFAEFHIHRLDNNLLPLLEVDLELQQSNKRKLQYMDMFDQQNVLPHSVQQPADICIQLQDLSSISHLTDYLDSMGLEVSNSAKTFHSRWLDKNINLFD